MIIKCIKYIRTIFHVRCFFSIYLLLTDRYVQISVFMLTSVHSFYGSNLIQCWRAFSTVRTLNNHMYKYEITCKRISLSKFNRKEDPDTKRKIEQTIQLIISGILR